MRVRGYAMAIVLLVSVLLSIALTSMFFALSSATKVTAKNLAVRRSQYICDGVVALATSALKKATEPEPFGGRGGIGGVGGIRGFGPNVTIEQLNRALEPLRVGVAADGVIIDQLQVDLSGDSRLTVVPSGGLAGLEVSVVDLDLKIGLHTADAPPCSARQVQPLASLSIFQFPAFSFADLSVTKPARGAYDFPSRRSYVWGKSSATPDVLLLDLEGRTASSAGLTLPILPEAIPAPRPTDLKFWTQQPNTDFPLDAPAEKAGARAAFDADIRIIDGEWFLRDPVRRDAWPGIPIWTDHPCTDATRADGSCSNIVGSSDARWLQDDLVVRRQYSRYERNGHGFLDGGVGVGVGAGVVSYGSVVGGAGNDAHDPGGFLSPSVCAAAADGFRRFNACASTAAEKNGPRAALADISRAGFVDEGAHLPINIDVGALGAALQTKINGELGSLICVPRSKDDAGGCRRIFNGILYVSSSHGTPINVAPKNITAIGSDPRVGSKLPWALCGKLSTSQTSLDGAEKPGFFDADVMTGCDDDDYAKIDAVRLTRADNMAAFAVTGLTVITDLPLYVQRDYNNGGGGPQQRAALVGERVTVLSSVYSDRFAPQLGSASLPSPSSTPRVRVQASIFAGVGGSDASAVVRVVEDDIDVDFAGALAAGWTPKGLRDHGPDRLRWVYPASLLSGAAAEHPPGAMRGSFVLPGARR